MEATHANISALVARRLREKPEATWREGKFTLAMMGNGGQFVELAYASQTEFVLTLMRGPKLPTASMRAKNNEVMCIGGRPDEILDIATHGWHFYQPDRRYGYVHEGTVKTIFWTEIHDSQDSSVHTPTAFQFVVRRQRMPQALMRHDSDSQAWMERFWTGLKSGVIVDMTERLANSECWLHSDGASKVWLQLDRDSSIPLLHETYDLWYAQDKAPDTSAASRWGVGQWQVFKQ